MAVYGFNPEKLEKFWEYLDTQSIVDFLDSIGVELLEGDKFKCIGHDENKASAFINREENVWHCMSCGRGGKLGHLIHYYYETNTGDSSYYESLEKYLKSNTNAQNACGFITLKGNYRGSKKLTPVEIRDRIEERKSRKGLVEKPITFKPPVHKPNELALKNYLISLQTGLIDLHTKKEMRGIADGKQSQRGKDNRLLQELDALRD